MWDQYFNKPYSGPVKKYLFEVLAEKYEKNEPVIDRLMHTFDMKKDIEALVELFGDIYQSGYEVSYNQFKEEIAKHDYLSKLLPPEKEVKQQKNNSIFKED